MNTAPLALSMVAFGSGAVAQTVYVPPVVVETLTHDHFSSGGVTYSSDLVQFPCTGGACNGPGFTASIGQGTTVVLRIEPPAGNEFIVSRAAGGAQSFRSWVYWQANPGDSQSSYEVPTITFENLTGTPPIIISNLSFVTDNGEEVLSENDFTVNGDFSFTAMRVEFTVSQALTPLSRTYNPVHSNSTASFGSTHAAPSGVGDPIVMLIQPIAIATLCNPGHGSVIGCPCSNAPVNSGRGCDNSAATGGASLSGGGIAQLSADALFFTTAGEKPTATSILMQGSAYSTTGFVYGQGVRCVTGAARRLFLKSAVGGSILAPNFAGGDPSVSARSAAKGDTITPGQIRSYLVYYRDPTVLGGCPSASTFNSTQTGVVLWMP